MLEEVSLLSLRRVHGDPDTGAVIGDPTLVIISEVVTSVMASIAVDVLQLKGGVRWIPYIPLLLVPRWSLILHLR